MNNFKKRELFAYQILKGEKIYQNKKSNLNDLLLLLKKKNSPFFVEYKIWIVLMLKWEFDYINQYLQNPSKLKSTIKKFITLTSIFINLSKSNWLNNVEKKKSVLNKWYRTKKAFDYMWNRTTKGRFEKLSDKGIMPRVEQIVKMLPKNFLKNSSILDSGCGTGRYIRMYQKYQSKNIFGLDIGEKIIQKNIKKFKKNKNIFFVKGDVENLKFPNNKFDFVNSTGVLHHSKESMSKLIKEHSRVLKVNGYMFVFIVSSTGGLRFDLWSFCRELLKTIPIKVTFDYLIDKINPLRIQAFLDHSYSEYQMISRKKFEKILKKNFSSFVRVKGILGSDCTPELYKKDKFFKSRFGEGDLRYLCKK